MKNCVLYIFSTLASGQYGQLDVDIILSESCSKVSISCVMDLGYNPPTWREPESDFINT